jgi:DNA-binding transcriptional ArsR family regulator
VLQAKAAAHPMRLRILRLCAEQELTNKQLADRLGEQPGTVLHHVRLLVRAGFLAACPVRTGSSGALEKPYRSTGMSWWLDGSAADGGSERLGAAAVDAFVEELREAGPSSLVTAARFVLHLSPDEAEELDRRILAVLDEYVLTDDERRDRPAVGGIFVLHHLAGPER